jgi:hypothetical protein
MVNKRDVEVFIVCLSCHFDMGKLPYHWAGGTPLAFSIIHVCLQWQELIWDLSQVAWGLGTRIQGTWDFQLMVCQAYKLVFVFTLTLTIQDAYDRGNESSKLMSTIIFGSFIKLINPHFPLRKGLSFLLLSWVSKPIPLYLKQAFELLWSNHPYIDLFNHVFYLSLFSTMLLSERIYLWKLLMTVKRLLWLSVWFLQYKL